MNWTRARLKAVIYFAKAVGWVAQRLVDLNKRNLVAAKTLAARLRDQ